MTCLRCPEDSQWSILWLFKIYVKNRNWFWPDRRKKDTHPCCLKQCGLNLVQTQTKDCGGWFLPHTLSLTHFPSSINFHSLSFIFFLLISLSGKRLNYIPHLKVDEISIYISLKSLWIIKDRSLKFELLLLLLMLFFISLVWNLMSSSL